MKDNFILYTQQYSVLESMTDEQLGKLLRALYLYSRDGVEPAFGKDGMLKMAFGFIRIQIDASNIKYDEKRERNRENIRKRWNKVNTKENKDTTEYDRIPSNTTEYDRIPKIDSKDSIDRIDRVDRMKDNKEDKSSMSNSEKPNVDAAEVKSSSKIDSVKVKSKNASIDYAEIKEHWNRKHDETHSAMRRMTLMSDNRKTMVRARLRDVDGDIEKLKHVIDLAMGSDFMNGNNGRNWVASFDWIFGSGGNFAKVLDGNYENFMPSESGAQQQPQPQQSLETGRQAIGERYKQAASKHESASAQDNKYRTVIMSMLDDLRKNPRNKAAYDSLARYYENGIIQRLGIDWKPEK